MGLLETEAARCGVFISDLKYNPYLNRLILMDLLEMPEERFSLEEWTEGITYLTGTAHIFTNMSEMKAFLQNYRKEQPE